MCFVSEVMRLYARLFRGRFDANFLLLRRKGSLVSVGNASGAVPPFPPLKLVEKNVRLLRPTYVPAPGLALPLSQR